MLSILRSWCPGPGILQLLTPTPLSLLGLWFLVPHTLLNGHSDLKVVREHSLRIRRENAAIRKIIGKRDLVRKKERLP